MIIMFLAISFMVVYSTISDEKRQRRHEERMDGMLNNKKE